MKDWYGDEIIEEEETAKGTFPMHIPSKVKAPEKFNDFTEQQPIAPRNFDADEIKEMVLFARSQKVFRMKLGDIEFEFSQLAFAQMDPVNMENLTPEQVEEKIKRENDDILFHSST